VEEGERGIAKCVRKMNRILEREREKGEKRGREKRR
jgi:hypothetical protein